MTEPRLHYYSVKENWTGTESNQGSKNWFIMAPVQSQWSNLQRLSRCDAVSKAFLQAVFWDGQGLWAGNLPGDISQVA